MLFFPQHLEAPLKALYPGTPAAALLFHHMNNRLLRPLPEAIHAQTLRIALALIVDRESKCPTPSVLRAFIGEAALKATFGDDFSFDKARERAKVLLAFPPEEEDCGLAANRILFGAVRAMGRETFHTGLTADRQTNELWQAALVDSMLSEQPLDPWPHRGRVEAVRTRRDFSALVAGL
jgi:hypothetical protein